MSRRGRKFEAAAAQVDNEKVYLPEDAFALMKKVTYANFDESIEVHFSLGIDPRHADQLVRGTLTLPHGNGKKVKVAAVVGADKIEEAKKAGADEVGTDDLVKKISDGWIDFDVLIASPDVMSKVGKLGRILGARGLMPSPKSGTVTQDVAEAIKAFKAGKVEYRNDKAGLVHLMIGKAGFSEKKLLENFEMVYDVVVKSKPPKSKGIYIKSISMCSTMGPGFFIEPFLTSYCFLNLIEVQFDRGLSSKDRY